jgi:hypothetical protein
MPQQIIDDKHDPAIAEQASLLERDLRTLVATITDRFALLEGADQREISALSAAREAAERALGIAQQLVAIIAKSEPR